MIRDLCAVPSRPFEVGGWLLGYWTASENALVVTHATPPASRGWPWGVRITGEGHRDKFEAAWAASEGHVTFLGDWHTHPGGPATPSMRDMHAMTKLATDEDYGSPRPLIAIVATRKWPWSRAPGVVAFYLRDSDGEVRSLDHESFEVLPGPAAAVRPFH
jgi:integrative and conjugative element protein (TIGR02256 family)